MRQVAVVDLDGTLLRGRSMLRFLVRVRGAGRVAEALVASWLQALPHAASRRGGWRRHRRELLYRRLFRGLLADEVDAAAREHAESLRGRTRPAVLDAVRRHVTRGDEVVILTGSPAVYVRPLVAPLGVHEVLGAELETVAGRLTGRVDRSDCRGPDKVRLFQQWLAATPGGVDAVVWAYGDSPADLPLLALADHPIRVGRLRWWRSRPK